MKYALRLLESLGIKYCTKRHLDIILEELKSQKPNAKKLLDKLGSWNENDLTITEKFITERKDFK